MDSVNGSFINQGPSQEVLFDTLRLGSHVSGLESIEFDFLGKYRISVALEGLHRSSEVRKWFFLGQIKRFRDVSNAYTGEPLEGKFVFGHWHVTHREGRVAFSDRSFFQYPLAEEKTEIVFYRNLKVGDEFYIGGKAQNNPKDKFRLIYSLLLPSRFAAVCLDSEVAHALLLLEPMDTVHKIVK